MRLKSGGVSLLAIFFVIGFFVFSLLFSLKQTNTVTNTWPYTTAGNYTYDSTKVTVADGVAKLVPLDQTDDDNDNTGGWGSNASLYNAVFSVDHLEISSLISNDVDQLPDNRASSTGAWLDMGSNYNLWHMDEDPITDSSGYVSETGTAANQAHVTTTNAVIGRAWDFDGTGDYISISTSSFRSGDETGTIAAWVKVDESNGDGGIWGAYTGTTGNYLMLYVQDLRPWIYIVVDGQFSAIRSSAQFSESEWTHIAATSDGSDWDVYINGVAQSEVVSNSNNGNWLADIAAHADTNEIVIGARRTTSYNEDLNGQIDEVAYWSRELSADEILQIYNRQVNAKKYGGYVASRIIDAGSSVNWSSLSWMPDMPYGKPFVDNQADESDDGYTTGGQNMTSNVALYHFEEDSYDGTTGEVIESSGDGLHGTATDNATTANDGVFGRAATFDGTNDYITTSTVDFRLGDSQGTVMFWVKFDDFGGYYYIISSADSNSTNRVALATWITDGSPYISYVGGGTNTIIANSSLNADEWYHLAYVSTGSEYKIYINGVEDSLTVSSGSNNGAWFASSTNRDNFTMGASYYSSSPRWALDGMIDEVAIFSTALSDTEILNAYKRGITDMRFQVRACDDAICAGDYFVGPLSNTSTYYSERNSAATGSTPTTSTLGLTNRYFQYQSLFTTDDASVNLNLDSVSIGPTHYPGENATIITNNGQEYATLAGFTETLGGGNACTDIRYQFGVNNTSTWYYYKQASSTWQAGDGTYSQANTSTVVNTQIASLPTDISNGTLYIKAFLASDTGAEQCELDNLALTYFGPEVEWSTSTVSVAEEAGSLLVTTTLASTWSTTTTVEYAFQSGSSSSTIGAGNDFTLPSGNTTGTITFAPNVGTSTISVTLNNDSIDEDIETIILTLTNPHSNLVLGSTVTNTISIVDNDTAGITYSQSSVNVTEGGATSTYTIVLDTEPTDNVTIVPTSTEFLLGRDAEFIPSPAFFVFSDTNWNIPQTLTITAVDDSIEEGAHTDIVVHGAASSDPKYHSISSSFTTVNVTDNDTAGVSLSEGDGVAVSESGLTSDTHTIVLTTQPAGNVEITLTATTSLSQTATSTFSVSSPTLTFTSSTWNIPQTITSTAIDDNIDNAPTTYTGTISYSASSSDGNYDDISIFTTSVTITDDDTAGVTQSHTSLTGLSEGTTGSYTLVLDTQPTSTVSVSLTSGGQTTLSPTSITFTSSTWDTAQTISVTAVDDEDAEGDHTDTITHTLTDTDGRYNGVSITNVSVSIIDNDADSSGGVPVALPAAIAVPGVDGQVVRAGRSVSAPRPIPDPTVYYLPLNDTNTTTSRVPFESTGRHTIEASSNTTDDELFAIVRSEPVSITIPKEESTIVDFNNDDIPDVQITYLGLNPNNTTQATVRIQELTNADEFVALISINGGQYETNILESTLTLRLSDDVALIAISNNLDFTNGTFQSVNHFTPTSRDEENGITTYHVPHTLEPDTTGAAYVYIRIRTEQGGTATLYDSIRVPSYQTEDPDTPCPLTKESAYKTPDKSAVYYITKTCTKRPFRNPTIYFTHFTSWSDTNLTDQETLDLIPDDRFRFMPYGPLYQPLNGTLMKTLDDPKVYLLINSTKHWIPSEAIFTALNFSWETIKDVTQDLINTFETQEPIQTQETRLPGMIVTYPNDPDLYLLEEDPRDPTQLIMRRIANMDTLRRLNYTTDTIITLPTNESFPFGELIE